MQITYPVVDAFDGFASAVREYDWPLASYWAVKLSQVTGNPAYKRFSRLLMARYESECINPPGWWPRQYR